MIDLDNPKLISEFDPDAGWKRALILHLHNLFDLRTFVETGTCWGDTLAEVHETFETSWSIELSRVFYKAAASRFAPYPWVHVLYGSSGELLPKVLGEAGKRLLVWLDAHPTGGESADNGDQGPIELPIVASLRPDALVMIDDCKPDKAAGYVFAGGEQVVVPMGWQTRFLHGVLILHDGRYKIPERFSK